MDMIVLEFSVTVSATNGSSTDNVRVFVTKGEKNVYSINGVGCPRNQIKFLLKQAKSFGKWAKVSNFVMSRY